MTNVQRALGYSAIVQLVASVPGSSGLRYPEVMTASVSR
jgi:hypothetical protein